MSLFDDDRPKKPLEPRILVGEPLDALSEADLADRITALQQEIERTKQILERRSNIRNAAESLFGKNNP